MRKSDAYKKMLKVFIYQLKLTNKIEGLREMKTLKEIKKEKEASPASTSRAGRAGVIDPSQIMDINPYLTKTRIKPDYIETLKTEEDSFLKLCAGATFIRSAMEFAAKTPELVRALTIDSTETLDDINRKFPLPVLKVTSEDPDETSEDQKTTKEVKEKEKAKLRQQKKLNQYEKRLLDSRKRILSRSRGLTAQDLACNQQIVEHLIRDKVEEFYLEFINHIIENDETPAPTNLFLDRQESIQQLLVNDRNFLENNHLCIIE